MPLCQCSFFESVFEKARFQKSPSSCERPLSDLADVQGSLLAVVYSFLVLNPCFSLLSSPSSTAVFLQRQQFISEMHYICVCLLTSPFPLFFFSSIPPKDWLDIEMENRGACVFLLSKPRTCTQRPEPPESGVVTSVQRAGPDGGEAIQHNTAALSLPPR